MAENMGKWASGNRKIAKSGHRVAAEMVPFPRRWHGGMISANQEAIWGMSVKTDNAFKLGEVSISLDIASVTKDTVTIKNILTPARK